MKEVLQAQRSTGYDIEKALVEKCLLDDRLAQRDLYYRYCNAMYTTAYRMLNNEDDAHDVLQEAFIQVFRDVKNYRFQSTLGAWIKTIVVRCALRQLIKNRKFNLSPLEDAEPSEVVFIPDSLSGEMLEKVILSLPEGFRTVFLLIEVEGYSHKESAAMMGISEGTTKSQLHHAKRMLQHKLLNYINK